MTEAAEIARALPRQARSKAVVDAILEAAAQLLEAEGERAFNTNRVAERAGVSIGSLYRYFPDKRAILFALGRKEMQTVQHAMLDALKAPQNGAVAPGRLAIRAFLRAFQERARTRRAVVQALLPHLQADELSAGFAAISDAIKAAGSPQAKAASPASPVKIFVLTRALLGAMRAAVLEATPFLHEQEFEDELVRLARNYMKGD